MKLADINKAKREALEFIRRADVVIKETPKDKDWYLMCGSRNTGALKRQSMELTNALADMRR